MKCTADEASLGRYLLEDTLKTGQVWPEVTMAKVQSQRHAANFLELYRASQNTALFLPTNGKYIDPPFLILIANARPFIGKLNTARGAERKSSLFNVATPECAHGLGCGDWLLNCIGVKHISEQYLLRVLAPHRLSGEKIAYLSTVRIGLIMYLHDTEEDNRKTNSKITCAYVARTALSLIMDRASREMLQPILTADLQALTDKPGLHKSQRLAAQKVPPQKEYELLRKMGLLKADSIGTGPIGTGKFVDKGHTLMGDFLIVETGNKSYFSNGESFAAYIVPRMDIVNSLHVPQSYKDWYHETANRAYERLMDPRHLPLSPKSAQRVIHRELARVAKILRGEPFEPARTKPFSYFSIPSQACP